uniref:Uncharacterized protein n=1 Tax=Anas platyrhynchos platyrhynchos TaxID=8840 RepID=A0A493SXW7_ANAPP
MPAGAVLYLMKNSQGERGRSRQTVKVNWEGISGTETLRTHGCSPACPELAQAAWSRRSCHLCDTGLKSQLHHLVQEMKSDTHTTPLGKQTLQNHFSNFFKPGLAHRDTWPKRPPSLNQFVVNLVLSE